MSVKLKLMVSQVRSFMLYPAETHTAVWEVGTAPSLTMAYSGLGQIEVDPPWRPASILRGQVRRQRTCVSLDSPSEERPWSARDRYSSDHLEDFTLRYKVQRISRAEGSRGPKKRGRLSPL